MKKYIFLSMLLTLLCSACEEFMCNLEAPTDLGCGNAGGICAVYHYMGGISYSATVYLDWGDVTGAEGYILYF